ncbi:uncharacterized protein LOC141613223 [Silene latifolia]|uniref:uncharacterized protein LOC141613223 n=1 Tax=Silene latifolia TaxID=37657 RepID=UPI003D781D17
MFFQLVYFHRMIWRGEPEARRLPLIQHWPYEAVKKRVKEECKAYTIHKGFGIGVLDLTTYPISLHLEKSFYRLPVEGLDHDVEPIRQEAARPAEKSTIADQEAEDVRQDEAPPLEKGSTAEDEGCRTVSFALPDDLPSDEDLRRLYNDGRVLKWYQTKRNQRLISRLHREVAAEMVADPPLSQQVREQQSEDGEAAGEVEETLTQKLDGDPASYVDFIAMLDQVDQALENVVLPPSFSLGIEDIGTQAPGRSYELRYTRARDRPQGLVNNSSKDVSRGQTRPVPKPGGGKRK